MYHLRTYLFAFAIIISFLPNIALNAKNKENQTGSSERDTIQLFRGIAVSYNLAGSVMRMVSDYGEIEAAARGNFLDRYFPTIEFGLGSAHHATDVTTGVETKTNAPFFRLGCDLNIAKNKHDIYRVLLGARYGFTSFIQKASGNITDPYWGGDVPYYCETSCNFHWAELLFALDAKLWGPVRLGWSFRYKIEISGGADNVGQDLWYVPGFGKHGNKLGATFNVTVELGKKNKKKKM